MAFLNLLLDLAALVLGLSALGVGGKAPVHRAGTLLGNLRPAEQRRTHHWKAGVALLGLLVLRPVLIMPVAEVTGQVPEWSATPASVPFRPDFFSRLLVFSGISFLWTALIFLTWMLVLTALARACREPGGWSRFFQDTLGGLARWPLLLVCLVPTIGAWSIWFLGRWPLNGLGLLPTVPSLQFLAIQSALVALGVWVSIRWLLAGLLLLRLINTYVYLGNHPFWDFVHQAGGVLLAPFRWLPLQFGKFDLAPFLAAALILAAGWGAERGLVELYLRLRP